MIDLSKYRELMTVGDLIDLGLYRTKQGAEQARRLGTGPAFMWQKEGIVYPKAGVLDYIKSALSRTAERFRQRHKIEFEDELSYWEKLY